MLETLSHQPERLLSVKSKFDAEFRRFAISTGKTQYDEFKDKVRKIHKLDSIDFIITYSTNGDLLPINNNDNYHKALQSTYDGGIIKVYIHRKNTIDLDGYGTSTVRRRKGEKAPVISTPVDFRPVSAIIDVDILPETLRRVRLHKHGSDKPLGFYIRDGFSVRLSDSGVEKVPSIFISRLVNGGLAEMTGLLAVDDEVLEVNSIEVAGKSLDQVTDMMVANSANLIITVKPASQRDTIPKNYKNLNYPPPPLESDSESDEDEIREMPSPSTAAKKTRPKDSVKAQRDKAPVTTFISLQSSKNDIQKNIPRKAAQKSASVVWRTPSVAKLTQHQNYRHSFTMPRESANSQNYKSKIIAAQNNLSSSTLPAQSRTVNKSLQSPNSPIPTFSSMSFSSSNSIRSQTSMNSTYL